MTSLVIFLSVYRITPVLKADSSGQKWERTPPNSYYKTSMNLTPNPTRTVKLQYSESTDLHLKPKNMEILKKILTNWIQGIYKKKNASQPAVVCHRNAKMA